MPIASTRPSSGNTIRRSRLPGGDSAARPKPMPVSTVNSGCANGDMTTRTKKVAAVVGAPPVWLAWSSPKALPRYRMFSVKAKPVAVKPAKTTPSTIPVKSRLRKRKSSRTAAAFALSSTIGRYDARAQVIGR